MTAKAHVAPRMASKVNRRMSMPSRNKMTATSRRIGIDATMKGTFHSTNPS